jgi:hypothetical protein
MKSGKEPFKCGMESAECGMRPNLISVIAKHRAPSRRDPLPLRNSECGTGRARHSVRAVFVACERRAEDCPPYPVPAGHPQITLITQISFLPSASPAKSADKTSPRQPARQVRPVCGCAPSAFILPGRARHSVRAGLCVRTFGGQRTDPPHLVPAGTTGN